MSDSEQIVVKGRIASVDSSSGGFYIWAAAPLEEQDPADEDDYCYLNSRGNWQSTAFYWSSREAAVAFARSVADKPPPAELPFGLMAAPLAIAGHVQQPNRLYIEVTPDVRAKLTQAETDIAQLRQQLAEVTHRACDKDRLVMELHGIRGAVDEQISKVMGRLPPAFARLERDISNMQSKLAASEQARQKLKETLLWIGCGVEFRQRYPDLVKVIDAALAAGGQG